MVAIVRPGSKSLATATPVVYTDFSSNFDVSTENGDLMLWTNEDSVKSSIRNIIMTGRQERPFNPTFGGELRKMLFEPISVETETTIQSMIQAAIENFEPRAVIDQLIVSAMIDQNAYAVSVVFHVINNKDPVTLDLLLTRIR